MKPLRLNAAFLPASLIVLLGLGGCWDMNKAPDGFGVVREHMIFAPHNVPPIRSELDFTILDVDGAPFKREIPPGIVDIQPGVLVAAGSHKFRARVAPHRRPPDYQPREVVFVANVDSGKVYYLVDDKNGNPVLIEGHAEPR